MLEAIRLVQEEEYSVKKAASVINDVKTRPIPRTSLSDRVKKLLHKKPSLGHPQEWYLPFHCTCTNTSIIRYPTIYTSNVGSGNIMYHK